MVKQLTVFLFTLLVLITTGLADPAHMPKIEYSEEFNKLKVLVGKWEGIHEEEMQGEPQKYVVEYKLTSNGSAILETSFPNTPHEMVSVFYDDKGKLSMKHYCALANQPFMQLTGSDENSISLDFAHDNSIVPDKEPHMHSLKISLDGDDRMTQTWTYYDGNGGQEIKTIKLARVK